MREFPGTPGTLTSLFLRIIQCVFAAGSIASMVTAPSFFTITAFCYLIASMGLQIVWSFSLAVFDGTALVKKKVLHNPVLVSLFVIGDWVTALLSLAAASSSAGIAILYFNDLGNCGFGQECQKYQLSVALAFLDWVAISLSSLILNHATALCRRLKPVAVQALGIHPPSKKLVILEILIVLWFP